MVEEKRERYTCLCPVCGYEFYACKSIAQEAFGIEDAGHGSCPKCKTFHNLQLDEANKKMIVTPWDEYLKKLEERKQGVKNESNT